MLKILFFASSPEILGDTQTIIGIFVTLIVLCLFNSYKQKEASRNNNNFIHQLFDDFCYGLSKANASYISQLGEKLAERNLPESDDESFWKKMAEGTNGGTELLKNRSEAKLIPQQFFQEAQGRINSAEELLEGVRSRQEDTYVELFIFVISSLVLVVDGMHISMGIGTIFVLFLSGLSLLYTTGLWIIYYTNLPISRAIENKNNHVIRRRMEFLLILLSLSSLWLFSLGLVPRPWMSYFIFLLLTGIAFTFFMWRRWGTLLTEKYNKHQVIRHLIYIILSSSLLTGLFVFVQSSDWAYTLFGGKNQDYFQNWNTVIASIQDVRVMRILFLLYVAVWGIFTPIFGGFILSHFYAYNVKRDVRNRFIAAVEKSDKTQEEYKRIVKKIKNEYLKNGKSA
jgi:hypothetical protein